MSRTAWLQKKVEDLERRVWRIWASDAKTDETNVYGGNFTEVGRDSNTFNICEYPYVDPMG